MSPRDRYLICQGDNGLPVQIELKKGKREGERERERGEREKGEHRHKENICLHRHRQLRAELARGHAPLAACGSLLSWTY